MTKTTENRENDKQQWLKNAWNDKNRRKT